jgi:hypothetical protein
MQDTIGSGIDINTPFGLTLLLTSVYAGAPGRLGCKGGWEGSPSSESTCCALFSFLRCCVHADRRVWTGSYGG